MLFKKETASTNPTGTTSVGTPDLLNQIADLTKLNSELTSKVTHFENLAKLTAFADKAEFTGDVSALFAENNGDYTKTLEGIIENKATDEGTPLVKANQSSFLKDGSTNQSAGEGSEESDEPKTQAEAIQLCKNDLNLTQRQATVQAKSLYPTLWKTK